MKRVRCRICNKFFQSITYTHLKKHRLLPSEYKIKFGYKKGELHSKGVRKKQSVSKKKWIDENPEKSRKAVEKSGRTRSERYRKGEILLSGCAKLAKEGRMVVTKSTRRKISKSLKGRKRRYIPHPGSCGTKNPMKRPEVVKKQKMSLRRIGHGKKISVRMKKNNPMKNKRSRKKMIQTLKVRWEDKEFAKRMIKAQHRKPTIPEKRLDSILQDNFPNEWKYVGNGDVWFGRKNPDFINCNGQKRIIELFGVYFHSKLPKLSRKEAECGRIECFLEYGFETLVIWDDELDDKKLIEKIRILWR